MDIFEHTMFMYSVKESIYMYQQTCLQNADNTVALLLSESLICKCDAVLII